MEAELNGVEEVLITERLRKELDGTTLHRLPVVGMSPCPVMKTIGPLDHRFRIISGGLIELEGPRVNDGLLIEAFHGSHDDP